VRGGWRCRRGKPLRDYRILHQGCEEGARIVDKVRVYYDRTGNTLTVWFDDPAKESVCEEVDDDVVLMKDRRGRVIGFERLNYLSRKQQIQGTRVPVEVEVLFARKVIQALEADHPPPAVFQKHHVVIDLLAHRLF